MTYINAIQNAATTTELDNIVMENTMTENIRELVAMGRYDEAYTILNNAGAGYAVGEEDDDINELAELLGAELIVTSTSDDRVAVYRRGEQLILVGDAHGPWAVSVD